MYRIHELFVSPVAGRRAARAALGCGLVLAVVGCDRDAAAVKTELPVPMVTVAVPKADTIRRYELFTGRVAAPEAVEVRGRVSGYLVKVDFTPGAVVKQGDLLLEIDPDTYRVDLEKAEAGVELAEARVKQTAAELARYESLRKNNSVSASEYDRAVANKLEAQASVRANKAEVAAAKLNLGYTKIAAPFTGQVGDKLVSVGNLVTGGQGNTTLLTTLMSVDPMHIAFDVDENTLERIQELERSGKIKLASNGEIPVEVGLSLHGTEYPLRGGINFADNQVDPKTGTIRLKAAVPNPEPPAGARLLKPGLFARVRVPIGDPTPALLVPESAIQSDQGVKYLYTVAADNKAVRVDITPGVLWQGVREIESVRAPGEGKWRPLRPDERVIVSGVQRVRPGMAVDPKPAPAN